MVKHLTRDQQETFERLKSILSGVNCVKFTLVGAAACREYGLVRETKDLDIVILPYLQAKTALLNSREFREDLVDRDFTDRTCTLIDEKTSVRVDLLTGGIRINDGPTPQNPTGFLVDRLAVPVPTGFGDVASLPTLIGIKLSTVISGVRILKHGAATGVRSFDKIRTDIDDIRSLISSVGLDKNLQLGDVEVERTYSSIHSGEATPSIIRSIE